MVVDSTNGPPSPPRSSDDHHSDAYELRSYQPHNMVPQTPPMHEFAYRDPDYYQPHADEYDDETWYPAADSYRTPPRAIAGSGIQTRSGRSLGTPMTSAGSPSSRVSHSPRRRKKPGKSAKKDYHITEPLSVMTKDYDIAVEDMEAFVNRPDEDRVAECAKKPKGGVPRPMNSFMLYRRAYKNRIKHWGKQGDNNQMISSVAGESWHLEPEDVRAYYIRVAKLEADNHARAFPDYKFQPNKDKARNKRQYHDTNDETGSEWDGDSSYSRKRPRAGYREMTRSRSTTPAGIMYDSPQYHHAPHPAANPNPYYMPFHQEEPMYYQQWAPQSQYGQHYAEYQQPYLPQAMPHGYGPRSVPVQQDLSFAAPVALPPSTDIHESIDPSLSSYMPQYEYGGHAQEQPHIAEEYEAGLEQDIHPGDQTLAPAQSWSAGHQPGHDFDVELDSFHH